LFEWDAAKSARNARERKLPFVIAMALFDSDTLEQDDRRRDYGERRIKAIGMVAGRCLVCVYTWRGTSDMPIRRIISLRVASRKETHAYCEAFPRRP
jgi:uncharacterized protein